VLTGQNKRIHFIIPKAIVIILFCGLSCFICNGVTRPGQVTDGGLKRVLIYGTNERIDSSSALPQIMDHQGVVFEMKTCDGIMYRYRISKIDSDWSGWTFIALKEYTNLNQGQYVFSYQYKGNDEKIYSGHFNFRVKAPWYLSAVALCIYPFLLLFLIMLLRMRTHRLIRERQKRLEVVIKERTDELRLEKEKSDRLLANMLPKGTAEEIMSKGKAEKVKYNFVTVLFSDIQGFTRIAETMNPELLIDELDRFFFHFDSVVEKYRIEKIKTIGDAYMCAGGIPERNRTNPVEVVLAALEMQQYMTNIKNDPHNDAAQFWDIRVGIHTGTVIAGVVGHKKLTYDIWGDTVNTASRMESSGEAGKVNISGTTYEFVKEYFTCEYRGRMPVKYKGDLDMYFVTGINPILSDDDGTPNKKFFLKLQMIRILDVEDHVFTDYVSNASPDLFFHSHEYVRNICLQTELLAKAEKLTDDEYINVRLAAVFLFYGYVYDYSHPFEVSLKRAEEILSYYGFSDENMQTVRVLVTNAFSAEQNTQAGAVLHDAIYDFTGRIDFPDLISKLYREEKAYKKVTDIKGWFENIKHLIVSNDFLTETGKLLHTVKREDQLMVLENLYRETASQS
jgi:adenylate cyclase